MLKEKKIKMIKKLILLANQYWDLILELQKGTVPWRKIRTDLLELVMQYLWDCCRFSANANHSVCDNVLKSLERKRTHYEAHNLLVEEGNNEGAHLSKSRKKIQRAKHASILAKIKRTPQPWFPQRKFIYCLWWVWRKVQQFSYFQHSFLKMVFYQIKRDMK